MALSVIVPVYNEREAVCALLAALERALDSLGPDYAGSEIIAVDDGSDDGTAQRLEGLGGRVRVVRHKRNLGYGASLKTGLRHAAHELAAIIDADGTYPPERLPELVRAMDGCDMAVGARRGPGAAIPTVRRPAKWVLNVLADYLSGFKIPDINSGMRVFRRSQVERFMSILPDGFSFTTTITLAFLTNGLEVRYLDIDYARRTGRSKIRPLRDTLGFMSLIVRTVLYFRPLRVFMPLSLLFFAISIGVLFGSYFLTGAVMDATTIIFFVTGVQLGGIGLLADLISRRLN